MDAGSQHLKDSVLSNHTIMSKLFAPAIWISLLFGACGFITLMLPNSSDIQVIAIIGLFFMIAFLIGIFIHEVGHVIGAVLANFQIVNFVVGPIQIAAKVKGGYKLLPNMNPPLWAGLVLALPHTFTNLRRRFFIFVSGGLIASLIFGLILAVWAGDIWASWRTAIPNGVSPANFNLWSFGCLIGIVGWVSLFLFLTNILPIRTQGTSSDGLKLLQLSKNAEEAKRSTALLIISCLLMARDRPSHIPEEIVEDSLAITDNSPEEAQARSIAYVRSLDTNVINEAEIHIEGLKRLYRNRQVYSSSRAPLTQWVAFHEAIYRENKSEARQWLNEANSITSDKATILYHMASASVLFLEGQNQEALKHCDEWATLFSQEAKKGGSIILFFKTQLEKITKRNILAIKSTLPEVKR